MSPLKLRFNIFRRILEEKKVSLENVIVRESESIVVGTVKVRNLSFDKEVVVRVTYDKWKSQEDIQCTYSSLGGSQMAGGAYALFDTFSFKLTLPPSSKRSVEFCVCFRCDGQEYWDSNNVSRLPDCKNRVPCITRDLPLPMSGSKLYALEASERQRGSHRKRFHPHQPAQRGQDERGDDHHSGPEEFLELRNDGRQFATLLVAHFCSGPDPG